MMKKAIEKLEKEIEDSKDNAYIKVVGEYLVNYIKNNDQFASNILEEKKTIKDSLDFMKEEARKKAKSSMAMFTPEEGYKIVLDYYEIEEKPMLTVVTNQRKVNISLDDLL